MKIYYAHAICTYGSEQEEMERKCIKKEFSNCVVVDPSLYENDARKRRDGMQFCKGLISSSDVLVFTRLLGKITSGVGIEINHALGENKPVFELNNGKMHRVKSPVKYISRENTIKLYNKWRMQNFRHFSGSSLN